MEKKKKHKRKFATKKYSRLSKFSIITLIFFKKKIQFSFKKYFHSQNF